MTPPEILIVANRLPVITEVGLDGERRIVPAPGGLVSALAPVAAGLSCTWLGIGDIRVDAGSGAFPELRDGVRLAVVNPDPISYADYYEGFANQVLWPIFHGLPEYAAESLCERWWHAYQAVNREFAGRIAETAAQGSLVWVHDYHLLLVPGLLKQLRQDLHVAVFLHIPFPDPEALDGLSWSAALLEALAQADTIGVQRDIDAERLNAAFVRAGERPRSRAAIHAVPISIEIEPFERDARAALAAGTPGQHRERFGAAGRSMLLSVDRLDYTKGIIERLKAFERLLETWHEDTPQPVLVQVVTPTRETVPAYRSYAVRVEAATTRITERFGAPGYTPIVTLTEALSAAELVELYLACDVMCVTPLRDGMNLVAKEFLVSRVDERGALVLGREAGAADELREAHLVDPHDRDSLVNAMYRALTESEAVGSARMLALRDRVLASDVHDWGERFLRLARENS